MRSSVDFPAPERPMTPVKLPRSICKRRIGNRGGRAEIPRNVLSNEAFAALE